MGKSSRNKNKAKKVVDGGNKDNNHSLSEERFVAAETRPQFKVPKANDSKVVLDDRFSSVLTDSRFQLQEKDKYGRKKKKKRNRDAAKEELESFYVVENKEENNRDDDNSINDRKNLETEEKDKSREFEPNDPSDDEDEKPEDPVSRIAYLTAFSRGEIGVSSSSEDDDSSESSDDDDDSDEDSVHGTAGILDPSTKDEEEIEISYDLSPYLVVTNMDWENIRAVDLFCILSSFAPPGAIKKVQVFQSDFGMEQMAKDRLHGPTGIWQKKKTAKKKSVMEGRSSDTDESDEEDLEPDEISENEFNFDETNESDFDPEKLRAYEASKLKYFFAVTELSQPEYGDVIYREVDGMEFEHSSTAIDLRTLPKEALESVVTDRPIRDEATSIPAKYDPPDFIVSALQQTNVQCTWDQGDKEREKKLTNYGSANWQESFEADDLKAYLASDASSDEGSDGSVNESNKKSMMRKALGLDGDSDSGDNSDSDSGSDSDSSDDDDDDDSEDGEADGSMSKQIRIIPGSKNLEERIRSKLDSKEPTKELTPWEKYQEKRKQKRKERRQAARGNRSSENSKSKSGKKDTRSRDKDDFFASDDESDGGAKFESSFQNKDSEKNSISKSQKERKKLELLLTEEQIEEDARDYDIRGIQRLEKNKGKKLKGSRKRKEAKIAADVSGTDFKINVNDNRFKAVLDGSDGRFGIDKTDPNYKDTTSMRKILSEQTKRRKNKRQKKANDAQNASSNSDNRKKKNGNEAGASALSFLVQKLKSQVDNSKS